VTLPIATHLTSPVCLYVCMSSVTPVHPAKANGRNEIPFGRDTHVVPINIVLDGPPVSTREGRFWWSESPVLRDATYCKLLWILF